jgi:hypothetical protein
MVVVHLSRPDSQYLENQLRDDGNENAHRSYDPHCYESKGEPVSFIEARCPFDEIRNHCNLASYLPSDFLKCAVFPATTSSTSDFSVP